MINQLADTGIVIILFGAFCTLISKLGNDKQDINNLNSWEYMEHQRDLAAGSMGMIVGFAIMFTGVMLIIVSFLAPYSPICP